MCLLSSILYGSYNSPQGRTLRQKIHGVRMDHVLGLDQRSIEHEAVQKEEELEEVEAGVRVEVEKAIGPHQSGRGVLTMFRS